MMPPKPIILFLATSLLATRTLAAPVPPADTYDAMGPLGKLVKAYDTTYGAFMKKFFYPLQEKFAPIIDWKPTPKGPHEYKEYMKMGWPWNDYWNLWAQTKGNVDEANWRTVESDADMQKVRAGMADYFIKTGGWQQGEDMMAKQLEQAQRDGEERGRQLAEAKANMKNLKVDAALGKAQVEVDCTKEFWKGKKGGDTIMGLDGNMYKLLAGCDKT
jgi:hypothetical protein